MPDHRETPTTGQSPEPDQQPGSTTDDGLRPAPLPGLPAQPGPQSSAGVHEELVEQDLDPHPSPAAPLDLTEADRRRKAKDQILIAALAAGMRYPAAAEAADVGVRTVERRMADPEFAAAVSRKRGEVVSSVVGQMVNLLPEFQPVLAECLHSERPADRLRAIEVGVRLVRALRSDTEIEDRLAALERALEDEAADTDDGETD
jgi:hypothetical protein